MYSNFLSFLYPLFLHALDLLLFYVVLQKKWGAVRRGKIIRMNSKSEGWWWWRRENFSSGAKSLLSTSLPKIVYLYKIDFADSFGLLNYSMLKSSRSFHLFSLMQLKRSWILSLLRENEKENFHFMKGEHYYWIFYFLLFWVFWMQKQWHCDDIGVYFFIFICIEKSLSSPPYNFW